MFFQNAQTIRNLFLALVATATLVGGLEPAQAARRSESAPAPSADFANLQGRPLVSVRYIALVDEAARERVINRYTYKRQFGTQLPVKDMNEEAFEDALAKTTYYSAELTEIIKAQIPDADVVMTPLRLSQDDDGRLVANPILQLRNPDVCIEFFAYVHPSTSLDAASTHGRRLMPFISVSSRHLATSITEGSVMRPDWTYFMDDGAEGCPGLVSIVDFLESSDDAYEEAPKAIKKAKKLARKKQLSIPYTKKRPMDGHRIMVYSPKKKKLGGANDKFDSTEIFTEYSHIVIDTLNIASARNTTPLETDVDPQYASAIDPHWAIANDKQKRLDVIKKIYETELEFMQRRDAALTNLTHDSDWGAAFREMRDAEASVAAKATAARWAGIIVAVAVGVEGHKSGANNLGLVQTILESGENKRTSLVTQFIDQFRELRIAQAEYTIQITGQSESVKIESLPQLRNYLRGKYAQIFPGTESYLAANEAPQFRAAATAADGGSNND